MQSTSWTPQHSEALREYLARGMCYSDIADAINAKFKTAYSRNAAIGRARRMGLAGPQRPQDLQPPSPKHWSTPPGATAPRLHKLRERYQAEFLRVMPVFEPEPVKLRCVEIGPRLLTQCAPSAAGRSRARRLPLPPRRRGGGRGPHVLRPSAARRFELLRAAF